MRSRGLKECTRSGRPCTTISDRDDIAGAVSLLEDFLIENEAQRFSVLVGSEFSNRSVEIVAELDRFVEATERAFTVEAIYLEMNGFDINYDRWYFDLFAYSSYKADPDDLEWLCYWESRPWPEIALTGMGPCQEAFRWYHENQIWDVQREFKPIYDAAMLLTMAKFAALIGESLSTQPLVKPVPVLARLHMTSARSPGSCPDTAERWPISRSGHWSRGEPVTRPAWMRVTSLAAGERHGPRYGRPPVQVGVEASDPLAHGHVNGTVHGRVEEGNDRPIRAVHDDAE